MMCSINTRSTLELMLDLIKQRDEQPVDVLPALPIRPVSRARLPVRLRTTCLINCSYENEGKNKDKFSDDIVLKKNDSLNLKNDSRERPLEKILEIQKSYRGHQVRCYYLQLKKGSITLQSFIRGETTRKNYQLLSRRLEAVITLQSAIRGWLTRRSISYKEKFRLPGTDYKEDIRKPGTTVSPSTLAEFQRRLLIVETELGNKEEENAVIKRKLHQFDEKWFHDENNMKSMEKKWRDQLASLQMSLLATKNSVATKRTRERLGDYIPISLHSCSNMHETMPNEVRRTMNDFLNLHNDNETLPRNDRVDKSESHDEEFRNLKLRFEVWKKEYKVQLQEAKTMLQKLGHLEAKKSRKKCWW